MDNIKISVLVPVYNNEAYLKECMDSILKQDFAGLEVICLDDGSSDSSPRLLDLYAENDSRVVVIHKTNSGYGNTMNIGIENATGDYIAIVESDDFISANMFADLYAVAVENNLDFIKSDFNAFTGDGAERKFSDIKIHADSDLYSRVLSNEDIRRLFRGCIANWTGLYKRSFLLEHNIRHNESAGASYQDTGFFFQIMMFSECGYLYPKSYYNYRQDNMGASMQSREKAFCICDELKFIENIIVKNDKDALYMPVLNTFRLFSTELHVKRIEAIYRNDFLDRMISDFAFVEQAFGLDLSYMYDWEVEQLNNLRFHRDEYLASVIGFKDGLLAKLNGIAAYKELVIYGAGAKGKEVLAVLQDYLSGDVRISFAVTKLSGDSMNFVNGIRVVQLDSLAERSEEAVIIVAVTPKYSKEMQSAALALGFKNVITLG